MQHTSSSAIAKGVMGVFGVLVLIVNAAVTWQFGTYFLDTAFGIQNPDWAGVAGGGYAILFLDIAALVWFLTYVRLAETPEQRGLSLAGAVIAFVGSLAATAYMLAQGTVGMLNTYAEDVSTASQFLMILIVLVHAVFLAVYMLKSRDEAVNQTAINASASATASALSSAEKRVQDMVPQLGAEIADALEAGILSNLGFSRDRSGGVVYVEADKVTSQITGKPRPIGGGGGVDERDEEIKRLRAQLAAMQSARIPQAPAAPDQKDIELARLREQLSRADPGMSGGPLDE